MSSRPSQSASMGCFCVFARGAWQWAFHRLQPPDCSAVLAMKPEGTPMLFEREALSPRLLAPSIQAAPPPPHPWGLANRAPDCSRSWARTSTRRRAGSRSSPPFLDRSAARHSRIPAGFRDNNGSSGFSYEHFPRNPNPHKTS